MRRPLLSLALVPLLALASIGLAAALWSEAITIDGEVVTAEFDAGWTFGVCAEVDPLSMGSVEIVEADAMHEIPGLHNITLKVDDAYPTYRAVCGVEYTYTGSILARVQNITFDQGNLTGCVVTTSPTGQMVAECDQLKVEWVDGLCTVLDANDTLAGDLKLWVNDGVDPDTEYDFTLGVQIQQLTTGACPG